MAQTIQDYTINQLEISQGLSFDENTPIEQVLNAMRERKVSCVVCTTQGKISGVLTERDVFLKIAGQDIDWQLPVSSFVTVNPVTLDHEAPLKKALYLMGKNSFRHIPIVNDSGALVGVLSIQDVVVHIAEHFPEEVLNLPPKLHQVATKPEGGK
ncbi:MAG: CBS domain-containing protein [Bdellovibrionota bacterium]